MPASAAAWPTWWGRSCAALGEQFQVLCITHLPQIAAAGHVHFQISKSVVDGRTQTRVVRLSAAERVEELARMIGGAAQTDAARAAARELLDRRKRSKPKGESERPRSGEGEESQERPEQSEVTRRLSE